MRRPVERGERRQGWKRLFRWPAFLLANVALLLLVGVSTLRESYRGWTVDREIRALEARAEELEGRKLKLLSLTESLNSPEQVDLEARLRLGWKKDGEHVVVLTGMDATTTPDVRRTTPDPSDIAAPSSHFASWWNYFFKK